MIGTSKTSKKKMILYGIVIAVMILGNVFIYLNNSDAPDVNLGSSDLAVELSSDITNKSQSSRTKAVIEHNLFITLEKIGDWPVKPKNVGKADPFVPFFQTR